MLTFGNFKDSVQRLKKYMTKMNLYEELNLGKASVDQRELKNKPAHFFLQIIHYVLTEYSIDLYRVILDLIPNLKTLSDQKFSQSALNISRKILNMDPQITAEQFLSNKFIEKKVQFVANLCMNVFQWSNSKKNKGSQLKSYIPFPTNQAQQLQSPEEEEDEDLKERRIDVKPTQFSSSATSLSKKPQTNTIQIVSKNVVENETISFFKKPTVFPKSMERQYQQDQIDSHVLNSKKGKDHKAEKHSIKPPEQISFKQTDPEPSFEYVSRDQFNELLMMMSHMNTTVNELVSKFTTLQNNVTYWINNANAKVSILEENIKMIKANL